MDVVRVCNMLDEMFVKPQQRGAQQNAAGGSRELRGSKRNKISRGAARSANKCHQPGLRGAATQARQLPNAGQQVSLEEPLRAALAESTLSGVERARADACLEELRSLVGKVGPEWSLELFGSLASRFSTSCSDVDATCFEAGGKLWEAHDTARFLRDKVIPLLPGHPRLTLTEEVFNAKVPIVRLSFDGKLDIDLSCQNTQALRNTRYLRAHAGIDERVRELGIAVKLWAKGAGVCGAASRHLSSYTFTLLVIYFMQVSTDVNLPCLPTSAFEEGMAGEEDSKVQDLRSNWSCSLGLADLLWRFFHFYTREFFWGHEVVSPRLGRRLYARDTLFTQLRGRWATRLHVEDPFKLERNLHHVLGDAEEVRLIEAMQQALYSLQLGALPVGLLRAQPAAGGEPPAAADASVEPAAKEAAEPGRASEELIDIAYDSRIRTWSAESHAKDAAAQEAAAPAEELVDGALDGRSRTCSAESGGTCSTESGGEEAKLGTSAGGSSPNGSSQPSDEDSEVQAEAVLASGEGVQPGRWQRRQQLATAASRQRREGADAERSEARELGGSCEREGGGQQAPQEDAGEPAGELGPWWRAMGAACAAGANAGAPEPDAGRWSREGRRDPGGEEGQRQLRLWRSGDRKTGQVESAPRPATSQCFTVQDLERKMSRQPMCLTVQDLEDKMGRGPGAAGPAAPTARPFAALATNKTLATNKIQSKVSKLCLAQVG